MAKFTIDAGDIEYGNGICVKCGEVQYGGCEPDMRNAECESCGEKGVYGLEQAILEQRVELGEGAEDALGNLM